jgi:hypothetical protein
MFNYVVKDPNRHRTKRAVLNQGPTGAKGIPIRVLEPELRCIAVDVSNMPERPCCRTELPSPTGSTQALTPALHGRRRKPPQQRVTFARTFQEYRIEGNLSTRFVSNPDSQKPHSVETKTTETIGNPIAEH